MLTFRGLPGYAQGGSRAASWYRSGAVNGAGNGTP